MCSLFISFYLYVKFIYGREVLGLVQVDIFIYNAYFVRKTRLPV